MLLRTKSGNTHQRILIACMVLCIMLVSVSAASAEVKLDWKQVTIGLKPWYRIPESEKKSPTDARGDDNPDIMRYMGNGELSAEYRGGFFSALVTGRNNLRSHDNHGSLQLDLILPIHNEVNFYIQAFNGYGESLIDYNRNNSRIGIGVMIGRFQ